MSGEESQEGLMSGRKIKLQLRTDRTGSCMAFSGAGVFGNGGAGMRGFRSCRYRPDQRFNYSIHEHNELNKRKPYLMVKKASDAFTPLRDSHHEIFSGIG